MHLILPDVDGPTRVSWGDPQPLDDDRFYDLCVANPDLRIERNATGEVVIVAPVGGESDYRSLDLGAQLATWAKQDKPVAARKKFLPVVPDFVAEVLSPSDRLKDARQKMDQWIANGVGLGWLVDGDNETVFVYRPGQQVVEYKAIERLEGEGPLTGFVADFEDIWAGL